MKNNSEYKQKLNELIGKRFPFGKYKGQLVTEVVKDEGYCHWLLAQDRFKNDHPKLYATIFEAHPNYTPEVKPEPAPKPPNHNSKRMCALAIRLTIKHFKKQGIEPKLQMVIDELTNEFTMKDVRACWKSVTGEGVEQIKTTGRERKEHHVQYLYGTYFPTGEENKWYVPKKPLLFLN